VHCDNRNEEVMVNRLCAARVGIVIAILISIGGCRDVMAQDTQSLLIPILRQTELVGMLAGFGTTFAAAPDLIAMLKRRSSSGMNPRMAAITGVFQILWIYYGSLIASRPVVVWNVVAVSINFMCVAAYFYFVRAEKALRKP
jgi:MtN3 and saliva related transmembrane protein